MSKFVHLHLHSHYSLLDGLSKIDDIIKRVKENGMTAVALTDHGSLYGAVEFYKKAKKAGIKPILGVEAYLAPYGLKNKRVKIDEKRYHQVLLAKNNEGWRNICKLVTISHLEGFYYKPRIDKEALQSHKEGLICLSGCFSGELARLLKDDNIEEAESVITWYKDNFGEDYYLEVQEHNPEIHEKIYLLSKKFGVKVVATQDTHYPTLDDKTAHEVLLAVQTNNKLNSEDRLSTAKYNLSITTPEEVLDKFKDHPDTLENTLEVAEKCNVELVLGKSQIPRYPLPVGENNEEEYLYKLIQERLKKRFPKPSQTVLDRLEMEFSVIKKTGFLGYFLIVQDFVNWAKDHGIVVGPGRGSAAGSLISYILNITNLDPLKYDLLFERFLNPDRIQVPDIDIDFTDVRRDEVLAYVRSRYGADHVAQIITFGTMAAKAAIRDAGRALGLSYGFCDTLAKMIPFNADISDTMEQVPEFKSMYERDEDAKRLIDAAKKLEGVARHASVHACGVVISPEPLTNYMAIQKAPQGDEAIITQFEMHAVEDLGLLKMDFLGLKNLTIIEWALRLIRENHGIKFNIDDVPLDDDKVFEVFRQGETTGVFQFESAGMRRYLKELKPTELEDVIAMVALYRPGPMDLIPSYIARKHGKEEVTYLHEKLAPILGNTYGIGVYQEQMMRIARDLAGFTLAEADTLRKAIGKKIKELLDEQKDKLINGMIKNKIEEKTAKEIWELFPPFARYGFNRCLTGDTKIYNPNTGVLRTISELHKNKNLTKTTLSLNKENKITTNTIIDVIPNGKKQVFEVLTRSGRKVTATKNHPFYTKTGWTALENIQIGAHIATPRYITEPQTPEKIEKHKLALLGYILSEGNTCHPNSFYYYSKNKAEIKDYISNLEQFKNTKASINTSKSAIAVYARRINKKQKSEAAEWIKDLNLQYKKATEKFIPEIAFRLNNEDLSVLIAKMFQGDGCINTSRKDPQIFYATSSKNIASSLQHLLLRFKVLSTIHPKKFKYRNQVRIGYTISISRHDNIGNFLSKIQKHLVGSKKIIAQKILTSHPIINGTLKTWSARGTKDIIPTSLVMPHIHEALTANNLTREKASQTIGCAERLFYTDQRKIGFLRETALHIGIALDSKPLSSLGNNDIYWDEIISIQEKGEEATYDLEMQNDHNFIANDIFVHNSHAACYAYIAYQTAYLKAHYPVEYMTALLNVSGAEIERVSFLIQESNKMGIQVHAPDVNSSFRDFTVDNPNIRFGLSAIKNVGTNIVDVIINERNKNGPFTSLADFLSRIKHRDMNKKSIESLLKAGALDSFGIPRAKLFGNLEELLRFNQAAKKIAEVNQSSLFSSAISHDALRLKDVEEVDKLTLLSWEKELIGLYISSHPFEIFYPKVEKYVTLIKDAEAMPRKGIKSKPLRIAGIITSIKKITTKNGQPMLFVTLEDTSGALEVLVFADTIKQNISIWQEQNPVIMVGAFSYKNGDKKYICDQAKIIPA